MKIFIKALFLALVISFILTPSTQALTRRIFVTSTLHNGNFRGLRGADSICQSRAEEALLEGRWRALLATSRVRARDRLGRRGGDFVTLTDRLILETELFDGTIGAIVHIDEKGFRIPTPYRVWTGFAFDGQGQFTVGCRDWRSDSRTVLGANNHITRGRSHFWINATSSFCNERRRLYCFEITPEDE